jgi:predicted Fe-Mo cluster-binding NifX family protein
MKIYVTTTAKSLDSQINPRFGRCSYFAIIDSEIMQLETIPNKAISPASGAGIQSAQAIAGKGVTLLITGNIGSKGFQVLSAAGVEIAIGAYGTARDIIEKFKSGELRKTGAPIVGNHFGI